MRKWRITRALVIGLALVTALIFGGAGAATANHHDDDDGSSVVDASDNNAQVPAQVCHNHVPVNVLGVQVPVQEIAAAVGLPIGSDESSSSGPDSSCDQASGQENHGGSGQKNGGPGQENDEEGPQPADKNPEHHSDEGGYQNDEPRRGNDGLIPLLPVSAATANDDDDSSVVDASDNNVQALAQVCHNHVPVNVLGVQVPVQEIAASLGLPIGSDESPSSGPDSSCDQASGQENQGGSGQTNGGSGQENNDPGPQPGHKNDDRRDKDDEGLLDRLL